MDIARILELLSARRGAPNDVAGVLQAMNTTKPDSYVTSAYARPDTRPAITPDVNFLSGTAKPGPYQTQLPPTDELRFRDWVMKNRIPFDPSPTSDYDMRGFWKAAQAGDPRATTTRSAFDGLPHFPDDWKTPYHRSFSSDSMYATKSAPGWSGDDSRGWALQGKLGNIVYDERLPKKLEK